MLLNEEGESDTPMTFHRFVPLVHQCVSIQVVRRKRVVVDASGIRRTLSTGDGGSSVLPASDLHVFENTDRITSVEMGGKFENQTFIAVNVLSSSGTIEGAQERSGNSARASNDAPNDGGT